MRLCYHGGMAKGLSLNSRFKLGLLINTSFMAVEYAAGLLSGSLILIADATHNLTDSVTLVISWLGNRIARKPADTRHTLGHGRITVLAAYINSTILVATATLIFIEAYRRFIHPAYLDGWVIAGVGAVGVIANTAVASLFRKDRADLNVRAAYTNMAFDAVFSVAALVAGGLIALTHKTWIDPAISIGVGIGLLYAAFGILKQAVNIFLEGAPTGMDVGDLRSRISAVRNVKEVTELYIWSISSTEHVLCCSVIPRTTTFDALQTMTADIKRDLKQSGFKTVIVEVASKPSTKQA